MTIWVLFYILDVSALILSLYSQSFHYQLLFATLVLQVLVNIFGFSHIVKYHL